jgi:2-polyprenyl-3-methyl-5-hydroxy-6-metoxy-1,4-benzoquinol methylase
MPFVDLHLDGGLEESSRRAQHRFYQEDCNPEFEIARPRDCGKLYQFLIERKFTAGLKVLGLNLRGKTLLEICAGSGMMSEKFASVGAAVTATDFSEAAVCRARERARRYGFSAAFVVVDAQHLAFPDLAFDIVAVHDGLHHLDNPQLAIREMARVAREGVLIMDPAEAAITRIAVKVGVAKDVEEAGNAVKRLDVRAVAQTLRDSGFGRINWRRIMMYYPHQPGSWFRWFDTSPMFLASRGLFEATNALIGRYGNKLFLAALREPEPASHRGPNGTNIVDRKGVPSSAWSPVAKAVFVF